eukprot:TRINITY_DN10450_c0_g1_i1.p1 TRINITY_DN10450_c0_g1~~TRINITY_DN10450_c0_g1_i1.p1  ORF type:complete len:716 (-),score=65.57 TRINITY_DN10450_c0_g1_i1:205-2352(-)
MRQPLLSSNNEYKVQDPEDGESEAGGQANAGEQEDTGTNPPQQDEGMADAGHGGNVLTRLLGMSKKKKNNDNEFLWTPVLCFLAMGSCFAFLLSMCSGFMMQVCFVWLRILVAEDFQCNSVTFIVYLKLFLLLPVTVVLAALWFHEHWLLLLSLFDTSYLATSRSVFFSTFADVPFRHNFWFEAWFTWGLFGLAAAGVGVGFGFVFHNLGVRYFSASMLGSCFFIGVSSGATLWSLITVLVYICCELHMHTVGTEKRDAERCLRYMLRFVGDPTASMLQPHESFRDTFSSIIKPKDVPPSTIGSQRSWLYFSTVAVGALVANILLIVFSVSATGTPLLSMLCLVNVTFVGGVVAQKIVPTARVVFWSVIITFLMVMVSLLLGSTFSERGSVPAFGAAGVHPYKSKYCQDTPISPYPVCSMRWGSLNIIDLAILAQYSYVADAETYEHRIRQSFDNAPGLTHIWTTFNVTNTALPMVSAARFVAAADNRTGSDSRRGTVVITVKGTTTFDDVLLDATLFAEIKVLQFFSLVSPLLDTLPNILYAWLLDKLRLGSVTSREASVLNLVSQAIRDFQHNATFANDNFILVGHSLGGSIAQAVGSHMRIPTVVFSAPGSHFTRWSMNTTMEAVYRNVVGIKPDYDEVPDVDRQDGMIQKIECREKSGARRSIADCHLISTTLCELERACGDPRGRDFVRICTNRTETTTTGCYLEPPGDT